MKNPHLWKETKYVTKGNKLIGSRDTNALSGSSRLLADMIADHYKTAIGQYVHGTLLDLGCGYVPLYGVYKPYANDVVCVDWDNTLHKNEHLDLIADLNKPLPLENERFDTVILSDVLEHISEPKALLGEIHRVLNRNGVLIMNVPFLYCMHEQPYDFYRYTQYAYAYFARELHFDMIKIEPIGGAMECFTDLVCKIIIHIPLIGIFLSECTRLLCVGFGKSAIGKKISNKSSHTFTLGYFVIMRKNKI